MNLSTLHDRLRPCDTNSPFVFISYSSADKEVVWTDAAELQNRGYNVWIDEANLDKSKESWKEDALKAIENINCELLIFYVSKNSLTSGPCLNELDRTISETTRGNHYGKVDFIAIDAEQVGNITEFAEAVSKQIKRSESRNEIKEEKNRVLFGFMNKWFENSNEKVRIHPKSEPNRIGDYYLEIEKELDRKEIYIPPNKLKLSAEKLYRYAVECMIIGRIDYAFKILEFGAGSYAPSALLLAHLYVTGTPNMPPNIMRADKLWNSVEKKVPYNEWNRYGVQYDEYKYYSEAIAFFLAHGEKAKDPKSLFIAAKIWTKKGSLSQTLTALKLSEEYGNSNAKFFHQQFCGCDENELRKKALQDEAPVE